MPSVSSFRGLSDPAWEAPLPGGKGGLGACLGSPGDSGLRRWADGVRGFRFRFPDGRQLLVSARGGSGLGRPWAGAPVLPWEAPPACRTWGGRGPGSSPALWPGSRTPPPAVLPLPLVPCPAEGRRPLLEVWGGGIWWTPAGHLSSSLLGSGPWFPARGSFGESRCQPSPGRELGLWGVWRQRWEWEWGGSVVCDAVTAAAPCSCPGKGAARGLAAGRCPRLGPACGSPRAHPEGGLSRRLSPGLPASALWSPAAGLPCEAFSGSPGPPPASLGPGAGPPLGDTAAGHPGHLANGTVCCEPHGSQNQVLSPNLCVSQAPAQSGRVTGHKAVLVSAPERGPGSCRRRQRGWGGRAETSWGRRTQPRCDLGPWG